MDMLCVCAMVSMLWTTFWNEALCMGGAVEMKALHRSLFEGYDPLVLPRHEYTHPTEVSLQLYIDTVIGLDTKHQLLNVRGFIRVQWTDELLQWRPQDHGNITEMLVPQTKIWKPDVYMLNSAECVDYIGGDEVLASVGLDGRVRWEPGFSVKAICKVDVSKYPFDVTVCPLSFVTWMHDNDTLKLTWPEVPVDLRIMIMNGEFEITSAGVEKITTEYGINALRSFETLKFKLRLARRPLYIIMSVVVPVTMLALLSLLSFIMAPEEPEKVTVSITVLLSFTVFLNVIDNSIPQTSDNISLLVVYVTSLVGQSFLGVVSSVLVLTVNGWDEKAKEKSLPHSRCMGDHVQSYANPICKGKCQPAYNMITNSGESSNMHVQSSNQPRFEMDDGAADEESSYTTTRAYRLNKALLIFNCTTLFLITSIIGTLMLL